MSVKLYLIPVPIAEDALWSIPTRTTEIAASLDFFIAERAKTARHCLKAMGIRKPLPEVTIIEIDDQNPGYTENALVEAIAKGKDIGLLSEAGCPGVADPGAEVVAAAHRLGIQVVPLVGPSSILLALMASGMNGQRFAFHGYLSPKRPELAKDLRKLEQSADRNEGQTQICIETPYRSTMVMEVALETLLPDTRFAIAQDLTGSNEWIRSLHIRDWKKGPSVTLAKSPAVFLIHRGKLR